MAREEPFEFGEELLKYYGRQLRRSVAEQPTESLTLSPHLTYRQILEFVQRRLDEAGRVEVRNHIMSCYDCAQLIKQEFRRIPERASTNPRSIAKWTVNRLEDLEAKTRAAVASTRSSLAAALVIGLSLVISLDPNALADQPSLTRGTRSRQRRKTASTSLNAIEDVKASLEKGNTYQIANKGRSQFLYIRVEDEVDGPAVVIQTGKNPAEKLDSFRLEFRSGDKIIATIEGVDGDARLTQEDFDMILAQNVDSVTASQVD